MKSADKQLKEKSKEIQKAFDREVARLNSMEPVLSEEGAFEILKKGSTQGSIQSRRESRTSAPQKG